MTSLDGVLAFYQDILIATTANMQLYNFGLDIPTAGSFKLKFEHRNDTCTPFYFSGSNINIVTILDNVNLLATLTSENFHEISGTQILSDLFNSYKNS
jgi:hypothetical protein